MVDRPMSSAAGELNLTSGDMYWIASVSNESSEMQKVISSNWSNNNNSIISEDSTSTLFPVSVTDTLQPSAIGVFTFPLPAKIIITCFLSLIILCAIIGNTLVCVAIFTERSLRKTSNFFYVSLAIADLLVAMVVMTFALTNDMMGHWIFGPIWCDIFLSADVMCSTASILNMCAICLDRFLHIKNPYHYDSTMTVRRTLLFITIIWLLSGLISFLPIHLGWHKTDDHNPYVGSTFICLLELNPIYAVCSSIISFFVPCIIMIAIYVTLYRFARRHVKEIKRTSTWSAQSSAMLDPQTQQQNSYKASDHKAAITLGVIMGTFLFCWMPFFTINITSAFCACVPPLLFSCLTWLGYINSVANPIIYPVFNKEFRVAFRRILSSCFSCCGRQRRNKMGDNKGLMLTSSNKMAADESCCRRLLCCCCCCCGGLQMGSSTRRTYKKADMNKNSRLPSSSSNLYNKVSTTVTSGSGCSIPEQKLTHLNGHSTRSFATDSKSDYTIASQQSTCKSDHSISARLDENGAENAHPLIPSPRSPQHNALDRVTVL